MKVISGLGGSGTSFVLNTLRRHGARKLFGIFDWHELRKRLNLSPGTARTLKTGLTATGVYNSDIYVLRRPDTFWTDWDFNPSGRYDPESADFAAQITAQRDYILRTVRSRSAGLPIRHRDLPAASLTELVASYLARLQEIEHDRGKRIVLVCGHWGEYGILRELGLETIYLIRDPFNSIVSHSKSIRHRKDYLRRGFTDLSSKEWIDNYLVGPHHYWIKHAQHALNHRNATIIRYQQFPIDWQQVEGLPDITPDFEYSENNIAELLEPALIDYIYDCTKDICGALGFDEIYRRIRGSSEKAGAP